MLAGFAEEKGALKRRVCVSLRQLQNETRCPTSYLDHVVRAMGPFMQPDSIPHSVCMSDKSLHLEAGVEMCELFACSSSNSQCGLRKVWTQCDVPEYCPKCGKSMRDKTGKMEPVFYYPLQPRLHALLGTESYRSWVSYEAAREKNDDYFTDVYDAPAWQDIFKGVPLTDRCGLLFCMDGYDGLGDTHVPCEFCNMSLPPWERYKSENMLLYMLMPKKFSPDLQSKFFDYVVAEELRFIHSSGIRDKVVRVIGISMDLRGREKFLQQQSCNSYYGCSVCHHRFERGLHKKCAFTGARLWLPLTHPLRNEQCGVFDFISDERRGSPTFRTTESVREAVALCQEENLRHYKGQYGAPLFCSLENFSYQQQNIPDIAHMLANLFKNFVSLQVGHGPRGKYKDWDTRRDNIHRAESEIYNVFPQTWMEHDEVNLPWRLSKEDVQVVDARVRSIVYPHHCETVGTTEMSFYRDTVCAWKMSQRLIALLVVMPTCLRGKVRPLHRAIRKLVLGIRILMGKRHSYNECLRRDCEPGSPSLPKIDVVRAHGLIVTALSMLEGSIPVSLLSLTCIAFYPNPNPNMYSCHAGCIFPDTNTPDTACCFPHVTGESFDSKCASVSASCSRHPEIWIVESVLDVWL